jgi:hypothetical protein
MIAGENGNLRSGGHTLSRSCRPSWLVGADAAYSSFQINLWCGDGCYATMSSTSQF